MCETLCMGAGDGPGPARGDGLRGGSLPGELFCLSAILLSCVRMDKLGLLGLLCSKCRLWKLTDSQALPARVCLQSYGSLPCQPTQQPLLYCLILAIEALDRLVAATIRKDCSGSCCPALAMLAGNSMVHYSADTSSGQVMLLNQGCALQSLPLIPGQVPHEALLRRHIPSNVRR